MNFSEVMSLSFSFFLLMDPIGNIPLFITILNPIPEERKKKIIAREMLIALFTILVFAVVGEKLLDLLDISMQTLSISGGIILFIIALRMIFSNDTEEALSNSLTKEPFIVPLAIPLIAGPSILAAVMIFAKKESNSLTLILSIIIAWIISFIILLLSQNLKKVLNENTILALQRLMGLILTFIAIEMLLKGVVVFIKNIQYAI
jgi:MarC family membrane protein